MGQSDHIAAKQHDNEQMLTLSSTRPNAHTALREQPPDGLKVTSAPLWGERSVCA
jgi:hypothetical protein